MEQSVAAVTSSLDPFAGAAALIQLGPIGLGGLMMVVGLFGFYIRDFDDKKKTIMQLVLWLGTLLAVFFGVLAYLREGQSYQTLKAVITTELCPAEAALRIVHDRSTLDGKADLEVMAQIDVTKEGMERVRKAVEATCP